MGAPLAFFTKTDTGQITNRLAGPSSFMYDPLTTPPCRFSQDMTILDAELPYSLIDLQVPLLLVCLYAVQEPSSEPRNMPSALPRFHDSHYSSPRTLLDMPC